MGGRTYSPEFKLQVVLEALQSEGTDAEVARVYDIYSLTLSGWKTKLRDNGSKAFRGRDEFGRSNTVPSKCRWASRM